MPVFVITNPRASKKLARHLLLTELGVAECSGLKRQTALFARAIWRRSVRRSINPVNDAY